MTQPRDARLGSEVARELCQRAGARAYLAGSISTLGSQYVIGLQAINCQAGESLAQGAGNSGRQRAGPPGARPGGNAVAAEAR